MKIKLLHLSDVYLNDHYFIPRIPETRSYNEDDTIKRICCSTSLSGCILAIKDSISDKFIKGNLRAAFAVHQFIIDSKLVIKPNKIQVFDSQLTDEHWILTRKKSNVIGIVIVHFNNKKLDYEYITYQ